MNYTVVNSAHNEMVEETHRNIDIDVDTSSISSSCIQSFNKQVVKVHLLIIQRRTDSNNTCIRKYELKVNQYKK